MKERFFLGYIYVFVLMTIAGWDLQCRPELLQQGKFVKKNIQRSSHIWSSQELRLIILMLAWRKGFSGLHLYFCIVNMVNAFCRNENFVRSISSKLIQKRKYLLIPYVAVFAKLVLIFKRLHCSYHIWWACTFCWER